MKDLLKITHVEDEICRIEVSIDNEKEGDLLAATILGILAKGDEDVKKAILDAVFCYMCNDENELAEVADRNLHEIQPTQGVRPALMLDDDILEEMISAQKGVKN